MTELIRVYSARQKMSHLVVPALEPDGKVILPSVGICGDITARLPAFVENEQQIQAAADAPLHDVCSQLADEFSRRPRPPGPNTAVSASKRR